MGTRTVLSDTFLMWLYLNSAHTWYRHMAQAHGQRWPTKDPENKTKANLSISSNEGMLETYVPCYKSSFLKNKVFVGFINFKYRNSTKGSHNWPSPVHHRVTEGSMKWFLKTFKLIPKVVSTWDVDWEPSNVGIMGTKEGKQAKEIGKNEKGMENGQKEKEC